MRDHYIVLLLSFLATESCNAIESRTTNNNHHLHKTDTDQENNNYRLSFPYKEDYTIDLLINPCGSNSSVIMGKRNAKVLGYDCCVDRFGKGEYGFLNYRMDDKKTKSKKDIKEERMVTHFDESSHNVYLVDEDGNEIPLQNSRQANDLTIINEECEDLRYPYPSCTKKRLEAIKSPYEPPCFDHNQTVDATADCFTLNGTMHKNCMQVGYGQNAYFHSCGGKSSNDPNCGTFIEIHRENGSPYDEESVPLSETKIDVLFTNGVSTTTISLHYKNDKRRTLCSYRETKLRKGSVVTVLDENTECCCPQSYNKMTEIGSYFCPKHIKQEPGPHAHNIEAKYMKIEDDEYQQIPPICPFLNDKEDALICSIPAGYEITDGITSFYSPNNETKTEENNNFKYTYKCNALSQFKNGKFSSQDLFGEYDQICPFGKALKACSFKNGECHEGDITYSFVGKVGRVQYVSAEGKVGVTFNDGRTVYEFSQYQLSLKQPEGNFELWFVQRNRFERIIQKKKTFRVRWPK